MGLWGGGAVRSDTFKLDQRKRPNVRINVLSWLAGGLSEGGELVLETAREGGTSPGLPCI